MRAVGGPLDGQNIESDAQMVALANDGGPAYHLIEGVYLWLPAIWSSPNNPPITETIERAESLGNGGWTHIRLVDD